MSQSLDAFAQRKLDAIDSRNLTRRLNSTARGPQGGALRAGRDMVAFCDNDYLGLSQHPDVVAAAVAATREFGAGAGASRLVTGNNPLYARLESRLAGLKGAEAALVFGSGYLANIGIIPTFAGPGDLILADELSHACMHAGARLSGAEIIYFRHNDAAECARLLASRRQAAGHCLILTEGVFSMDGDRAPVDSLAELAARYDAWLLVDDAHALGVIGGGRGSGHGTADLSDSGTIAESAGRAPAKRAGDGATGIDLQMGTLSKAVGAYGGYVAASRPVIDLLVNRARSLIFTTGLPPGVLAGAEKGLELIATRPDLVARPLARARVFTETLGLAPAASAIVPVVLGDAARALAAAQALEERGFLVTAIRPPTVPEGTSRLRVTFSAAHSEDQVLALAEAIRSLGLLEGCQVPQAGPQQRMTSKPA